MPSVRYQWCGYEDKYFGTRLFKESFDIFKTDRMLDFEPFF